MGLFLKYLFEQTVVGHDTFFNIHLEPAEHNGNKAV